MPKKKCEYRYEIVVDYGKPYSINICGRTSGAAVKKVKRELKKLREYAEKMEEDYAYFDVGVYRGKWKMPDETVRKWSGMEE